MIHPHTDLKFQVSIEAQDFSMSSDRWNIVIRDEFGRVFSNLDKSDCFFDTIGNFYFKMDKVPTGRYYAVTTVRIPDEDYDDNNMDVTDKQPLVEVGLHSCFRHNCECATEGVKVTFTRVFSHYLDGADYLTDKDGNFIYTSDGKRIQFINQYDPDEEMAKVKLNMTGDEFKQLIEGNDPNGKINTIPELVQAMEGINDTTTVKEEIRNETEDTYVESEESLYLDGEKPE